MGGTVSISVEIRHGCVTMQAGVANAVPKRELASVITPGTPSSELKRRSGMAAQRPAERSVALAHAAEAISTEIGTLPFGLGAWPGIGRQVLI